MINDITLANIMLGSGITLAIIGFLLWKIFYFEIKGEENYSVKTREKLTEWIGENLTIIGLITTILALLYKYNSWFNMIKTMIFLFLIVFILVIRFCIRYKSSSR